VCGLEHWQSVMLVICASIEKCYGCCYVDLSTGIVWVAGKSTGNWIPLDFSRVLLGQKGLRWGVCKMVRSLEVGISM